MKLTYTIYRINNSIYRIALPLPGYPHYINVYLFKGEVNTLFDAGISWTWPLLKKALKELGLQFSDIHQIIVSHAHIDHYGAVKAITSRSNKHIDVIAHYVEASRIEHGLAANVSDMSAFIASLGVPRPFLLALAGSYVIAKTFGCIAAVTKKIVHDEHILPVGDYTAQLIVTPGHSRGSMCLYIEKEGFLFSGDHIVPGIKPIILAGFEPKSSFPAGKSHDAFHNSLKKIEKLRPLHIFPAHGEPFNDNLNRLVKMYLKMHQIRKRRIHNLLLNHDYTAYALARQVFKNLKGITLIANLYLSLSETYTHAEALCYEGDAFKYTVGKTSFYTSTL